MIKKSLGGLFFTLKNKNCIFVKTISKTCPYFVSSVCRDCKEL